MEPTTSRSDDEREALVAEANRACAPGVDRTGVGYEIDLIRRLADALARKHPEPEMEYGRRVPNGGGRIEVWSRRETAEEWQRVWGGEVIERTKALPAGPRVPVGEGEQPAPKATLVDERDPACVAEWPECSSGEYDPRCCRFPKSCSAGIIRLVTPGGGDQ